jgi:hypothetical protein
MPFIASRLRAHCELDTDFALLLQTHGFPTGVVDVAEAVKTTAERFYQICLQCDIPALQKRVSIGTYVRMFYQDLAELLVGVIDKSCDRAYEVACGVLAAAGLAPVYNPDAHAHRARFTAEMGQGAVPLARWLQGNYS